MIRSFKLPKTVSIGGEMWKVESNQKHSGAQFYWKERLISIGTMSDNDVAEAFIHEVLECIIVARRLRFSNAGNDSDNGCYRVVMNHDEFEQVARDLTMALFERRT